MTLQVNNIRSTRRKNLKFSRILILFLLLIIKKEKKNIYFFILKAKKKEFFNLFIPIKKFT